MGWHTCASIRVCCLGGLTSRTLGIPRACIAGCCRFCCSCLRTNDKERRKTLYASCNDKWPEGGLNGTWARGGHSKALEQTTPWVELCALLRHNRGVVVIHQTALKDTCEITARVRALKSEGEAQERNVAYYEVS